MITPEPVSVPSTRTVNSLTLLDTCVASRAEAAGTKLKPNVVLSARLDRIETRLFLGVFILDIR